MKSRFGKEFRFYREGVFLLSLLIIPLIYQFIKPETPFELIFSTLAFYWVVPFLIVRFVLQENIYFLGFREGKFGQGLSGALVGWLVFYPILNFLSDQPEFQNAYPLFDFMKESPAGLLWGEFAVMLPAFWGVQTFLFGYAYLGLGRIIGRSRALLFLGLIGIPLFYLGNPPVEIILSSLAGLVACWIMNRSRSVFYPIVFGWGLSAML
ncbi:MAG: hypothetical protein FJZ04_03455, partial [Candidatus Moranbacteria bacterium]|nr:hypothetical protein [Candidatus Moranbacteria bacterium]